MAAGDAAAASDHFNFAVAIMEKLAVIEDSRDSQAKSAVKEPKLATAPAPPTSLPDLELISNAESVFSRETVASWTASERGLWKKYKRLMEDGDAALKRSEASQAAKLYVEGQRTMETLRGRIGEAAA
jgi:hypothetical protein